MLLGCSRKTAGKHISSIVHFCSTILQGYINQSVVIHHLLFACCFARGWRGYRNKNKPILMILRGREREDSCDFILLSYLSNLLLIHICYKVLISFWLMSTMIRVSVYCKKAPPKSYRFFIFPLTGSKMQKKF